MRAVSDKVLEVELENPIAYFDKLVAWHTYIPIREDFFLSRNGRYAADAEDLLFNGPFLLTRWVHGASLRFEKNPTYWNRDAIKLDVIDIPYITRDAVARLNLFQDGRVADVDYLPGEALDQVLQQRWPLHRYAEASMWMVAAQSSARAADVELQLAARIAARERSGRARLQGAEDAELHGRRVAVSVCHEGRARLVSAGASAAARARRPRRCAPAPRARQAGPWPHGAADAGAAERRHAGRDHALGVSAGVLTARSSVSRSASTGRSSGSASRSRRPASSIS